MVALVCACGAGEATVVATSTSAPVPATAVPTVAEPTATATAVPTTPAPLPTAAPETSSPAAVLIRGPNTAKAVALTFDAGSDPGYAEMILDTLAREGVKAGFGMTGQWAQQHASLVRRIGAEGHVFINHTNSHRSFTGFSTTTRALTQAERFAELDVTEQIIKSITGLSTKPFYRPPYGDYDRSVNVDVGLRGYNTNLLWTIDSRGWMGLPTAEIVQRCLSLAEPGAIYVFHVSAASQDGPALPAIIAGLRAQGYEIVQFSSFVR